MLRNIQERVECFLFCYCWRSVTTLTEVKEADFGKNFVDYFQFFFFFIFKFYFIFKLYNIVLVLPNIEMNPPQVYLCSPS